MRAHAAPAAQTQLESEHVEPPEHATAKTAAIAKRSFISVLCHACDWDRGGVNLWKHDAKRPGPDEDRDSRAHERGHWPDLIGEPTEQIGRAHV